MAKHSARRVPELVPEIGPNELVKVPNCISFVEKQNLPFSKKESLGTMKASFGHYFLFRQYSGASRALAWRHPTPLPFPPRAKAPAAFLVAIVSGSCRLQSSSICYVPVALAAGRRSYSRALRRVHAVLRSFSRYRTSMPLLESKRGVGPGPRKMGPGVDPVGPGWDPVDSVGPTKA